MSYSTSLDVHLDHVRYFLLPQNRNFCKVIIYEYLRPHSEKLDEFELEAPARDLKELKGRIFFLLSSGTLFALDPYKYKLKRKITGEFKIDPRGSHISYIMQDIDIPQGLCRIPPDDLLVWTKTCIHWLKISDDFEVISKKTFPCQNINHILYDRANHRLLVAYDKYLGFYNERFEEMYRLYHLTGGKYLLYVPYPEEAKKLDKNHPGFFRTDEENYSQLFDVLDQEGKLIDDEKEKMTFLKEYQNDFIVEEAISNYDRFVSGLQKTKVKSLFNINHIITMLPSPNTEEGEPPPQKLE